MFQLMNFPDDLKYMFQLTQYYEKMLRYWVKGLALTFPIIFHLILFFLLILVEWGVLLVNETKEQKNCNSICLQSFKRVKCRTRLSFNKFSFVPFVKLWREGARLGKWTWLQENKSSSSKCWKFKYRPTDHLNKQYTFFCCFAVFHCCLKPYFWKEK